MECRRGIQSCPCNTPVLRSQSGNHVLTLNRGFAVRAVIFLMLHIPMAYAFSRWHWPGQVHAVGVLLGGLGFAIKRDSARVLYVLGYIAGSEILWRMTRSSPVWEFGKYASVLLAGVALLAEWRPQTPMWCRRNERTCHSVPPLAHERRRISAIPLLYILLLLPSTILPLAQPNRTTAWNDIYTNFSGPLALAVLSLYLWRLPVNRRELVRFLLSIMAPVVGIAFIAFHSTMTSAVAFTNNSNYVTSGGFRPNQVSNALGCGALVGVMLVAVMRNARPVRVTVIMLTVALIAQGLLTFSRGGVFSFLLAAGVFGLFLVGGIQARRRVVVFATVWTLTAVALLASLDSYTHGALKRRFLDLRTTGRDKIAQGDIQAFREHPFLGTGIGLSRPYHRYSYRRDVDTHTEPTRMLAEHGVFGLIALLVLLCMIVCGYRQAPPRTGRGLTAGFAVWALSIMLHSTMRVVAVSLALGLIQISWTLDPAEDDDT